MKKTVNQYIKKLVKVFREVRRILKPDGTLWLNIADCYAGSGKGKGQTTPLAEVQASNKGILGVQKYESVKPSEIGMKSKDLMGIPWLLALALRSDGWYLRQDIIWSKPNPMPESVTDRCTKSHEYIFLLSKSAHYYFDYKAIEEPAATPGLTARRKRDVWSVTVKPFNGAHFATFPKDLIKPCILAGSGKDGIVLDPFAGSGTTGVVAKEHGRKYILIELSEKYVSIIKERITKNK